MLLICCLVPEPADPAVFTDGIFHLEQGDKHAHTHVNLIDSLSTSNTPLIIKSPKLKRLTV